jgi:hypothetical protein
VNPDPEGLLPAFASAVRLFGAALAVARRPHRVATASLRNAGDGGSCSLWSRAADSTLSMKRLAKVVHVNPRRSP